MQTAMFDSFTCSWPYCSIAVAGIYRFCCDTNRTVHTDGRVAVELSEVSGTWDSNVVW